MIKRKIAFRPGSKKEGHQPTRTMGKLVEGGRELFPVRGSKGRGRWLRQRESIATRTGLVKNIF